MRPKILSPAGTPEALLAALDAGADEVYFGLPSFNARQNARNFTADEAHDAITACRLRGVKTNITLNTLVTDRELPEAVRAAYSAACDGADAFIVQDMGLAAALQKAIPGITLHASTQCACHSVSGAKLLRDAGFERVVLARELGKTEIEKVASLGIETEVFVHGALCVCHSGMCLMSSVIGKRSGNRGLCAQPCRLPYEIDGAGKASAHYPLSLKDLSLARHIPELAALGITSLKIEGRMKPHEYVGAVTAIFKTLVTENRAATDEEFDFLARLFSRDGFTDGYYTCAYRSDNRKMYGVRRESDKDNSRRTGDLPASPHPAKRAVTLDASFEPDECASLTLSDGIHAVTVTADIPTLRAEKAPMDEAALAASLTKLGDTPFTCDNTHINVTGDVFLPKSALNALRRKASLALEDAILAFPRPTFDESALEMPTHRPHPHTAPTVRLYAPSMSALQLQLDIFADKQIDAAVLPLLLFKDDQTALVHSLASKGVRTLVRLPRVVFSEEEPAALTLLENAKTAGVKGAVAENVGHIPLIKTVGLPLFGGAALNVFNSRAAAFFTSLGMVDITLSPELNTAQMRDIASDVPTSVIAAGNLELMVLESCVVWANGKCRSTANGDICATLNDRTAATFYVRSEHRLAGTGYPCRNVILNGVPVRLIEKPDEVAKCGASSLDVFPTIEK